MRFTIDQIYFVWLCREVDLVDWDTLLDYNMSMTKKFLVPDEVVSTRSSMYATLQVPDTWYQFSFKFFYPFLFRRIIVMAAVSLLSLSSSSIEKTLTLPFTHTNWQLLFKFGCRQWITLSSDYSCWPFYKAFVRVVQEDLGSWSNKLSIANRDHKVIQNIATNIAPFTFTRTCWLCSIVVTASKYVGNFGHRSNLTWSFEQVFLRFTYSSKPNQFVN